MRFLPISFVVALSVSLVACDQKEAEDATTGLSSNTDTEEEVTGMRAISGGWRSQVAPLPDLDRKWIVVYISNDEKISMEIRSAGGKLEIVHGSAIGDIKVAGNSFSADLAEVTGDIDEAVTVEGQVADGVMQIQSSLGAMELYYSGL